MRSFECIANLSPVGLQPIATIPSILPIRDSVRGYERCSSQASQKAFRNDFRCHASLALAAARHSLLTVHFALSHRRIKHPLRRGCNPVFPYTSNSTLRAAHQDHAIRGKRTQGCQFQGKHPDLCASCSAFLRPGPTAPDGTVRKAEQFFNLKAMPCAVSQSEAMAAIDSLWRAVSDHRYRRRRRQPPPDLRSPLPLSLLDAVAPEVQLRCCRPPCQTLAATRSPSRTQP